MRRRRGLKPYRYRPESVSDLSSYASGGPLGQHCVKNIVNYVHCPKGNRFFRDITRNVVGKQDITRNISCSISFSSTFCVVKLNYFLDSVQYILCCIPNLLYTVQK